MFLTRRSIAAFVPLLLCLGLQTGGPKGSDAQSPPPPSTFGAVQSDTASIRLTLEAFGEAVALGEIERLEPLLAESVIEMAMNRPPIEGKDEVLRWWKAVVSQRSRGQARAEFTMSVAEVVVTGGESR